MGKINSRSKGADGERELSKLFNEIFPGANFVRNLEQSRNGGFDLIDASDIYHWALEVKRCEYLDVDNWWQQCLAQASDNRLPVLAYRKSRQPWSVVVPLRALCSAVPSSTARVVLSVEDFSHWVDATHSAKPQSSLAM